MKKSRILSAIVGFTLTISGALTLGSALNNKKEDSVMAATPETYTNVYRFTVPNTFGSDVGNHIYLHAWGSNGGNTTWGNFITLSDYSYNENSERVYTYSTNYSYTGFIIIRYSDNPDYCKTTDINVGSNKAWYWNGNNGASASAWTPTNQTYYLYDYKNLFADNAKCYAWQSNGGLNNGNYPGISMTKVQYGSGQLYSISLDPAFDRVKFGVGDSANTGDQWCNQNRGQTFCWWDTGNGTWNNDLAWVKAHDWVYNTMHVRDILSSDNSDTGACRGQNGYYQKAKTAFQSFDSSIKNKISQDERNDVAKARLSAWAVANGESFNPSTSTFSSARSISIIGKNEGTNTVIFVVLISLISVSAIGGYFFIRKRKEN